MLNLVTEIYPFKQYQNSRKSLFIALEFANIKNTYIQQLSVNTETKYIGCKNETLPAI